MKIKQINSQIITTISQQHVDYEEQWLVLEIAVINKDIKDNIYL
jgi:DNA-dependent RNA polymerase auxiliary subunit epsilon